MNKDLIPYIRLAMQHDYIKGYYVNRHMWDHEIIFIESGKMKVTINHQVYHVKENDVIFLRPHDHSIFEWDGVDCKQPHVHFDFYKDDKSQNIPISLKREEQMSSLEKTYFREDFYKSNHLDIPHVYQPSEPITIKVIMHRLINEFNYKLPYANFMQSSILLELISTLFRDLQLDERSRYEPYAEQFNRLIIYMKNHIDENLTLLDLANHINLSSWNLIQYFTKYYGITPIKFFNNLRHNRAKNLLQYSNQSIQEVAYKMNFNSPQSFSRWFKVNDGKPPSHYHNRA